MIIFIECIKQDEVPYQEESTLVRKIDQELLEELPLNYKYPLTYEQMGDLVSKLEILSKNDKKHKFEEVTLAFNLYQFQQEKAFLSSRTKNFSLIQLNVHLCLEKIPL